MMRFLFPLLPAFLFLCQAPAAGPPDAPGKPDIVLILADDLGYRDTGFTGSRFFETPNIDRLAGQGMVFPNAYASAGNCAPSRACLLSGNTTPRHGVYAVGGTDRGPRKSMRLVPVPNRSGLAPGMVTMTEALKAGGYTTGIFGKWHLSGVDGATPAQQGFDTVAEPRGENPNQRRNEPEDPKSAFTITRSACEFIEKNHAAHQPFFAFVSHHAIHSALEARPATLAKFQAKAERMRGGTGKLALYAACANDLDTSIGILLEKLDSLGIAGNTLVIFTSDNGATQQSSQEPLRGSKGGYYEGGIREPFIARWPGKIKPGTTDATPVIQLDLFPTFLAAAGTAVPDGKVLDGESILPLLQASGTLKRQSILWHFPGYLDTPVVRGRPSDVALGFRSRPVSVIRKGDWKLHLFHEEWLLDGGREKLPENHAVELYNLRADEGEHQDLSATEPAKRDELLDDLLAWFQSSNAILPQPKQP